MMLKWLTLQTAWAGDMLGSILRSSAGLQVSVLCAWLLMVISPLDTEIFPFQKSREDGKNE